VLSRPLLACVLPLALAACAPASPAPRTLPRISAEASSDTVSDRLFFGRNIPGGGVVSDSAWTAFLAEVVTPRFPAGLTVWRGEGQWLGSQGTIDHESAMVVEIIHPASRADEAALGAISDEYKRRFRQEAVLRVTTPAQMRFYE
jgi:hypothetical protein